MTLCTYLWLPRMFFASEKTLICLYYSFLSVDGRCDFFHSAGAPQPQLFPFLRSDVDGRRLAVSHESAMPDPGSSSSRRLSMTSSPSAPVLRASRPSPAGELRDVPKIRQGACVRLTGEHAQFL